MLEYRDIVGPSSDSIQTDLSLMGLNIARSVCDWGPEAGALSVTNGTFALDPNVLLDGKPTVKMTASATSPFTGVYTFSDAVSFANFRSIAMGIRSTCNAADSSIGPNTMFVVLTTTTGKTIKMNVYTYDIVPNNFSVYSWHRADASSLSYTGGATIATLDTEMIASISITTTTGANSANYPYWFGPMKIDCTNDLEQGIVSWVFDGNYTSQANVGAICAETDTKICFALTSGTIGAAGSLTTEQLNALYVDGHDMIHHTYAPSKTNGYVNATDWPNGSDITNDLLNQWAFFRTNGWTRGIGFAVRAYADIFAATTSTARQNLVRNALVAGGIKFYRGFLATVGRHQVFGYPKPSEFPTIYAQHSTANTTTFAQLKTFIDTCATNKTHLIIVSHGIDGTGNAGMTSAIFRQALEYVKNNPGVENMKFTDAGKRYYL